MNKNLMGTPVDVINWLRDTFGMPVNCILSDKQVGFDISLNEIEMPDIEAVIKRSRHYKWRTIMDRWVLYPSDPTWEYRVRGINITHVPRVKAARQYVDKVQDQIKSLNDLTGPPIKGDPYSSVYTEPVSLSPESSVVEHLVELLGANKQLVFTIERALSGVRLLHFQEVQSKQR